MIIIDEIVDDLVEIARSHLGTPFHPQGRVKGLNGGEDCAGFMINVAGEAGLTVYDVQGYPSMPSQGLFEKHVTNQLNKVDFNNLQKADLMIFSFGVEAQHIAMVTEVTPVIKIIHAYSVAGCVTEHNFDYKWERRLRGCFRFKNEE